MVICMEPSVYRVGAEKPCDGGWIVDFGDAAAYFLCKGKVIS